MESNKPIGVILELRKVGSSVLNIAGVRSDKELRQSLLNMIPDNATRYLLFELDDISDIKVADSLQAAVARSIEDKNIAEDYPELDVNHINKMKEMHQVQQLGEVIGYGNLMSWASALWRRHLKERDFPESGAFLPRIGEIRDEDLIYDQWVDRFKGSVRDIVLGGQSFNLGDRVRIKKAYSVLHYKYGMSGEVIKEMEGITGTIVARSYFDDCTVCDLKVDEPWSGNYKGGMTRLNKDDEVELINREEGGHE